MMMEQGSKRKPKKLENVKYRKFMKTRDIKAKTQLFN